MPLALLNFCFPPLLFLNPTDLTGPLSAHPFRSFFPVPVATVALLLLCVARAASGSFPLLLEIPLISHQITTAQEEWMLSGRFSDLNVVCVENALEMITRS